MYFGLSETNDRSHSYFYWNGDKFWLIEKELIVLYYVYSSYIYNDLYLYKCIITITASLKYYKYQLIVVTIN